MNKKSFVIFICFFIFIFNTITIKANDISISAIDSDSYAMNSDYGFKFKYIPNVTTYEYAQGAIKDGSRYEFPATNDSDFINKWTNGKAWLRFNNVGIFNGNIVDLKVSLISVDAVNTNSNKFYFMMGFKDEWMGDINVANVVNPVLKYEFFKHGTNEYFDLKGNITFSDIDDGQGIEVMSGGSHVFYENSGWLYQDGNAVLSRIGNLSEGTERYAKVTANYTNPLTLKFRTKEYTGAWFGFSSTAVAGFDTPAIYKTVSNTNVHNNDEYNYELNFSVPSVDESFKYSSFIIEDELPNVLETSLNNITLVNETGNSVNDKFTTTLVNNKIKIQMNNPSTDTSLYGHDYKITIVAKKKSGADVSPYKNYVPNTASITTNKGTKISNTVYNKFNHDITTSVTNGTITQSKKGVDATTNHTISYAPSDSDRYVLDKVTVNDNAVDITKNPDSYTITNINDDYNISVNYKRVYVIDTSVNNKNWGTVDERITKINSGDSKKISYKANDGYYIESLIIDGKTIPYDYNKYKDGYTFSNINADHTIQVVFKPYMSASVTKEIYDTTQSESNKKLTPNDLKSPDYNINTKNKDGIIPFILSMKDETTGEYQIIMYTNTEPFKIDFLKVGHTYTISEFPSLLVKFHSFIKPQNNNIFTGNNTLNKITFTISSEANKRDTYNIISKSIINYSFPSFEDTKDNLFKKIDWN